MARIKNACSVFSPPWPTSVKTQSYAFTIIPYFKSSIKNSMIIRNVFLLIKILPILLNQPYFYNQQDLVRIVA